METRTIEIATATIGSIIARPVDDDVLDELDIALDLESPDAQHIRQAAQALRTSDVPIAFPTETVYGLGADATRSTAVKGIYKAKQRPSDNPLIVHFASLRQLRSLLRGNGTAGHDRSSEPDPIPDIYKPLISRFWPGPLTIILPNPSNSPLAPEVTAGLSTFGARMPRHVLALALIQLANVPIAAPSANASTKPSPTAAEHVAYDLNGRIETILDGGPCDVGVESTVVDGLSQPPLILRPGGISLEQIRDCPGWETTQIGYKNISEKGSQPKAPGMKYRHYSPKAVVVLVESGKEAPTLADLQKIAGVRSKIGIVRTRSWVFDSDQPWPLVRMPRQVSNGTLNNIPRTKFSPGFAGMLQNIQASNNAKSTLTKHKINIEGSELQLFDINLGSATADIARGVFSALRDLDREDPDAILVEGIDDNEGDTAAAIMNRLRKAAEIRVEI